jgi:predicted molibdopterin-dependent oxidoreductase YjgC
VVGVALRRAQKNGARIITVNPRQHSYSLLARLWLRPRPGEEAGLLRALQERLEAPATDPVGAAADCPGVELDEAAALMREAGRAVILVGSEFMQYDQAADILEALAGLAEAAGAGVMPLPAQNNLVGSLVAGAYPETLPGGAPLDDAAQRKIAENVWGAPLPAATEGWNAWQLWAGRRTKVLYLMGELPPRPETPADFLIFQNIYPPEPYCQADLVLPAAAATESDGTFINGEGRVQPVRRAVEPPGNALPDWQILCRIARRMGVAGFDFADAAEIRAELGRFTQAYRQYGDSPREPAPFDWKGRMAGNGAAAGRTAGDDSGGPFLLTVSAVEHSHRGFPLSVWVEGS